jgi:hypothetical protein
MNGTELRAKLAALNIKQVEIAEWSDILPRSVARYLEGTRPIPGLLVSLVGYLSDRPEAVAWFRENAGKGKEMKADLEKVAEASRPGEGGN